MNERNIEIAVVEVGKKLEVLNIPYSLEALQEFVGGYIEAVSIDETFAMFVNADGLMNGLPHNFNLTTTSTQEHDWGTERKYSIVGPVIFVGINEDGDTVSIPERHFDDLKRIFANKQKDKYMLI